jgi:predicted GNAT family N-acyltransferase
VDAKQPRRKLCVREAGYAEDFAEIRRIRFAVFVREQGVPASLEMDERDPECLHVLAYLAETPVGTGRIDIDAGGKIGRVAVEAARRRLGVGRAIVQALHDIATRRGLMRVWCHAQVSAAPFYLRLGYRIVGGEFEEAGIAHVRMELDLAGHRDAGPQDSARSDGNAAAEPFGWRSNGPGSDSKRAP